MLPKLKKFAKENPLFFISLIATGVFIFSPILLQIPLVSEIISIFMYSLKEQGFKSSYIETLGAILGTFLAISGAVWTQQRFDKKEENDKKREHILIVYYDFFFAFQDIYSCMNIYMYKKGRIENFLSDKELFIDCVKYLKIYIHEEWVANVASIAKYLKVEEVKNIYEIYGELSTIKSIFEKNIGDISEIEANNAFEIMFKYITPCMNLSNGIVTADLREDTEKIMNLLKNVGRIAN